MGGAFYDISIELKSGAQRATLWEQHIPKMEYFAFPDGSFWFHIVGKPVKQTITHSKNDMNSLDRASTRNIVVKMETEESPRSEKSRQSTESRVASTSKIRTGVQSKNK